MQQLNEIIGELADFFCGCVAPGALYGLAVAGSHAKGLSDAGSDIDLFLYAQDFLPYEERARRALEFADAGTTPRVTRDARDSFWGGNTDFVYRGIPVEATLKRTADVDALVARTLEGDFEIRAEDWTTNGCYSYICLSELSFVQPLRDPSGILAAYREQVAVYPEKLRRAIVRRFWNRSGFWLDSFHYRSAIARADILFTGPIVQHLTLDLVQVLYAVNRVYFPGDKKLEQQLEKLPFCPKALCENLAFFMSAPKDPAGLELQRTLMIGIRREIEEAFPECF